MTPLSFRPPNPEIIMVDPQQQIYGLKNFCRSTTLPGITFIGTSRKMLQLDRIYYLCVPCSCAAIENQDGDRLCKLWISSRMTIRWSESISFYVYLSVNAGDFVWFSRRRSDADVMSSWAHILQCRVNGSINSFSVGRMWETTPFFHLLLHCPSHL
jgi:hypothetical protein